MNDIGTDLYDAVYTALPDVRATVTTAKGTIIPCLCASARRGRVVTDIGTSLESVAQIRVLPANDPDGLLAIDAIVTLTRRSTETKWRLTDESLGAGITTWTMEAANG